MKMILALFFCFAVLVSEGSVRERSVDLSKGGFLYIPGKKDPLSAPYSAAGKGIYFRARTAAADHLVLALRSPVKITAYQKIQVKVVFRTEKNSPLSSVDLRMRDRDWERCVLRCSSMEKKDGVLAAEWTIRPERLKATWGVAKEKQNFFMDLPLWITGFGIGYDRETDREFPVTLQSLEVDVTPESGTVSSRRLYGFGEDTLMRQSGGYRLLPSPDGLTVANIRSKTGWLKERKADLVFFREKPHSISLDAECLSETPVRLSWTLVDAAGKLHTTPVQSIAGPRKVYHFRISDADSIQRPYRIRTMNLSTGGKVERGAMIVYTSRVQTFSNPAEALEFEVLTGNPVHVLKNGEEDALQYRFRNTADVDGRFRVEITLTPWNGKALTELLEFDGKAGAEIRIPAKCRPERNGHWDVSARITVCGRKEVSVQKATFAKLTPAGPTPGRAPKFLFGVCSHPLWWSRRDQELEAMAAALCGVKYLRAAPEWPTIQLAPDQWNFRPFDALLEQYSALGIELQGYFGSTPKWAAKPEMRNADFKARSRSMPERNALFRFASTMAGRYRGVIRYWELYNEPDLSGNTVNADEFSEAQKTAYQAVKTASPGCVMMSGGFSGVASHPGLVDKNFMESVLKKARGSYEVHLTHNHGLFANYVKAVETHLMPLRKRAGAEKIPWFPNETALSSLFGTERNQALTLYKKLIYSWSRGAIGYVWYDLRNDGFDPGNAEHNYGMVTTDFYPKPVYSVYNHLAGWFRNADYLAQFPLAEGGWGFLFQAPGEKLVALWNEREYPLLLPLRTDAEKVVVSDCMGNETTLPVTDGIVLAEAGDEPRTIRFSRAGFVEPLAPLVQVKKLNPAVPGRWMEVVFAVSNPFREERRFLLSPADLPAGFQAEKRSLELRVPGRKTAVATFRIQVPSGEKFPRRTESFRLVCRGDGIETGLRLPVNPARLIRKKGEDVEKEKADFVLNTLSQVVSQAEADPNLEHRVWKGARDLSADVWLVRTENEFEIRAEVTDDLHSQPNSGFPIWKGDSMQVCFKLPSQDGFWEIGAARSDSGRPEVFVFHAPTGFDREKVARKIRLQTKRNGDRTFYSLRIPLKSCAMTPELLRSGFRFNLLINDNDGEGRDGWIQIAPGIGGTKNPAQFPFVLFE